MEDRERKIQIVALWQARPRTRRGTADVGAFYQWLVDYAPWLVPRSTGSLEQVSTLLHAHAAEIDGTSEPEVTRRRQPLRRRRWVTRYDQRPCE
jgi:hypothetical protein